MSTVLCIYAHSINFFLICITINHKYQGSPVVTIMKIYGKFVFTVLYYKNHS